MASELKTKKSKKSATAYLNAVVDPIRKRDAKNVLALMKKITGKKPVMWGEAIVGFDQYHYKSSSGQEGDWPMIGMSPRKAALTLYIMAGFKDLGPLLQKLGPHKKSVGCLYLKNLDEVHMPTLKKIITKGYKNFQKMKKTDERFS